MIHTFAAIYIGSYEVSIKIFEISGKKKIRDIDYIRSRIELGRDAYSKGSIGYELVEALCDTLAEYKKIMDGYWVDSYEAYAAAALRNAENELFILDQIRIRTGLLVKVLSNSEHRFISYKSVAMREDFERMIQKGAAVVDAGGGGMQITVFSKGKVVTTQHLALGTMRMREQLARKSNNLAQYELQVEELVDKELEVFKAMYLQETKIKYLIIIGDYISEISRKVEKNKEDNTIEAAKFLKYIRKLDEKTLEEISEELNLSNESDALVIPYMMIFKCMAESIGAESLWAPGTNVSDGIAFHYAQKNNMIRVEHDFEADVLSAARNLSERYMSYTPHIDALTQMATLIFDTMKKVHGLGRRERLLLQVAAILHDCGKFISMSAPGECAYQIIMSTEILGISHMEREMVACIVRYNTMELPNFREFDGKLGNDEYLIVMKLAAILRVCNALDRSHRQKFADMKLTIKDSNIVITTAYPDNITLEKKTLKDKQDFFEEVYGLGFEIKQKKKKQ